VLQLRNEASVVVIDVSQLSDSIRWEIDATLTHLPPLQIIIVGELSSTIHAHFKEVARQYLRNGLEIAQMNLAMYPSRRIFVLRFWKLWPFKLERLVHMYMRRIEDACLESVRSQRRES
jgi:hypothetical protein